MVCMLTFLVARVPEWVVLVPATVRSLPAVILIHDALECGIVDHGLTRLGFVVDVIASVCGGADVWFTCVYGLRSY